MLTISFRLFLTQRAWKIKSREINAKIDAGGAIIVSLIKASAILKLGWSEKRIEIQKEKQMFYHFFF